MSETYLDPERGYRTSVDTEIDLDSEHFDYADTPKCGDPLEEVIQRLRDAAEGLEDVKVSGNCWLDEQRDQSGVWAIVRGHREATKEEIKKDRQREREYQEREQREVEARARRKAEEDQRALDRARKAYPELFKEEDNA